MSPHKLQSYQTLKTSNAATTCSTAPLDSSQRPKADTISQTATECDGRKGSFIQYRGNSRQAKNYIGLKKSVSEGGLLGVVGGHKRAYTMRYEKSDRFKVSTIPLVKSMDVQNPLCDKKSLIKQEDDKVSSITSKDKANSVYRPRRNSDSGQYTRKETDITRPKSRRSKSFSAPCLNSWDKTPYRRIHQRGKDKIKFSNSNMFRIISRYDFQTTKEQ